MKNNTKSTINHTAQIAELMARREALREEIDKMPDHKHGTPWHTERLDEIHALTRRIHGIEDAEMAEERGEQPVEFREVWSNSPGDEDQSLQIGTDGSFRVQTGRDERWADIDELPTPAHVVEYMIQCILEKKHWPKFAAFMPTLYPAGAIYGSESLTIRAEFTGGAAGAIIAAAESMSQSPEDFIREAVCGEVCIRLASGSPEEAPDISGLFDNEAQDEKEAA
jgi:hypothetical protein